MVPSNGEIHFDLNPIFHPKSIVIIGLSSKNSNHPANVMFSKNLMEMKTKTYGISPHSENVDTHNIFKSIIVWLFCW